MPSSPSFAIFGLTLSGVATSVLSTALSTAQSTAGDGRDRKEGAAAAAAAPAGLREALLSALVWPATLTVPLVLHRREVYTRLLPRRLYEEPVELGGAQLRPPLGLALGIGAVVVGQVATIAYHYARRARLLGTPTAVQVRRRAPPAPARLARLHDHRSPGSPIAGEGRAQLRVCGGGGQVRAPARPLRSARVWRAC